MRILLTVAYDGTDFCGYQIQPNGRTVEEVLNGAIFTLTGENVKSVASGRTDSGVHAYGQAVHFDTESAIPPTKFACALNAILPQDVKVLKSRRVSNDFHARYGAKQKTYVYSYYLSEIENPMYSRYSSMLKNSVSLSLIKESAKLFEGSHDFKAFMASGSSVKDTVRTIYSLKVAKKGKLLTFTVTGNGFLYNMVRIIAGSLISVGEGKLTKEELKTVIDGGNRVNQMKTAEAKGLALVKVEYERY